MKVNVLDTNTLNPMPEYKKVAIICKEVLKKFLPFKYITTFNNYVDASPVVDNAVTLHTLLDTFGFTADQCKQFIEAYKTNLAAVPEAGHTNIKEIPYVETILARTGIDVRTLHKEETDNGK